MWYAISNKHNLTILSGDIVAVADTRDEVHEIITKLIDAKKLIEQPISAVSHKN